MISKLNEFLKETNRKVDQSTINESKLLDKLNDCLIKLKSTGSCIALINVIIENCVGQLFKQSIVVNNFLSLINSGIKK
jgi:hypothetical protein